MGLQAIKTARLPLYYINGDQHTFMQLIEFAKPV